jgi:hypothetical protein
LGSPAIKRSQLGGLLKYPFVIEQYVPKGLTFEYSNAAMIDVKEWVEREGERLMFTYGEFDPWSAGKFPEKTGMDCHWNVAPAENHRSNVFYLSNADKEKALKTVTSWIGKRPLRTSFDLEQTLDALEFKTRQRLRL